MTTTRRRFLAVNAGLLSLFSGCTFFSDDRATLVQLEVKLINSTEDSQVFHFVLEATDGLGEWWRYEVDEGVRETVVVEPDRSREYLALHGVVNDQHVVTELDELGSGDVCPRVLFSAEFDVHVDNEPILVLTTRVEC